MAVEAWFAGPGAAPVVLLGAASFGDSAGCGTEPFPPGTRWIVSAWAGDPTQPPTTGLCSPHAQLGTPEGEAMLAEAVTAYGEGSAPEGGGPTATPEPSAPSTPTDPSTVLDRGRGHRARRHRPGPCLRPGSRADEDQLTARGPGAAHQRTRGAGRLQGHPPTRRAPCRGGRRLRRCRAQSPVSPWRSDASRSLPRPRRHRLIALLGAMALLLLVPAVAFARKCARCDRRARPATTRSTSGLPAPPLRGHADDRRGLVRADPARRLKCSSRRRRSVTRRAAGSSRCASAPAGSCPPTSAEPGGRADDGHVPAARRRWTRPRARPCSRRPRPPDRQGTSPSGRRGRPG